MKVLTDLFENPLDIGYLHRAQSLQPPSGQPDRAKPAQAEPAGGDAPEGEAADGAAAHGKAAHDDAAHGRTPGRGLPHKLGRASSLLVCVLAGLVVAAGAVTLRAPSSGRTTSADLVTRIQLRRAEADERSARADQLRSQIATLQAAALAVVAESVTDQVRQADLSAGAVPLRGPGVIVTVDDAERSESRPGQPRDGSSASLTEGVVLAGDLQHLVNAVWAAQAEGVQVNGQRLTSTSAIGMAGRAIVAGYRPLTRPYVIAAVGPPDLAQRFTQGEGGQYLTSLRRDFEVRAEVSDVPDVTLSAGTVLTPRYAVPLRRQPPGASAARTTEDGQ